MEIIIGRNAGTRQLNVELGAKVSVYGQANTVPLDVSRRHISLTKRPDQASANPHTGAYLRRIRCTGARYPVPNRFKWFSRW